MIKLHEDSAWYESYLLAVVSGVFLFAGVQKIRNPTITATAINMIVENRIVSERLVVLLGILEICLALMMCIGVSRIVSLGLSLILMFLFLLFSGVVLILSLDIYCGCFGGLFLHKIGFSTVTFQVILSIAIAILYRRSRERRTVEGEAAAPTVEV